MTQQGKSRQSGDLRLGDSLLGLPCLQRRRAELTSGLRGECATASRGVECPLCGVETTELVHDPDEAADRSAIRRMQNRFPGWQPEDGVCEPCLERFRELAE